MKRFLMSVVVFSPMLLCAMQGDSAVGTAIVEDRARNDAAGYGCAIKVLERALARELQSGDRADCLPVGKSYDNYGGVLASQLRALMVPGGERGAVDHLDAFVQGFTQASEHWLGHDATCDEMLQGLIEAKKRRDEAAK